MSAPGPPPNDNPPPKLEATAADRLAREPTSVTPPPPPTFRAGQEVPSRPQWTLVKEIGRGGFGEVWQAKHEWEKRLGAVKFCTHPLARGQLVAHEKRVIVRVMRHAGDHPHIIPLIDYDLTGNVPWLMYEYVDGGTLIEAIVAWRDLPLARRLGKVVLALYGLSRALKKVHRLDPPIVHRDLKPANVLMSKGVPRITDFGIGGAAPTQVDDLSVRLPTMLASMGTSRYASPEQMFGAPPNPRDDVYALGVMAYQMIVGDLKTQPGTDAADIMRGLRVPPELISLIVKSVAMDPMRRPETAREWERALRQWMPPKKPKPGSVPGATTTGTGTAQVLVPLGPVPPPGTPVAPAPAPGPAGAQPITSSGPNPTTAPASATAPPTPAAPVEDGPQTLVLSAVGALLSRPAGEPEAGWKEVAKTPATVTLVPELVYCVRVKETAIDGDLEGLAAAARCRAIVQVNLAWCEQLTDAGLAHLKDFTALQGLDLMGCKRLTNAGVSHLAKMAALEHLNLRWCSLITDVGLAVVKRLPALQTLDLMGCGQITDAGIAHLRVLPQLRHLNLRWCEQVTDAGLAHLEKLTKLRYLSLWNCTRVSDAAVAAFKAAVPECHVER